MKKLVGSKDEAFTAKLRFAAAHDQPPADASAARLRAGRPALGGDLLRFHLTSADFPATADPADRYLALLAWCAANHAADFADFISRQESGRRYLMFDRDEINEVRGHNHARQIDGTQFWAVMTIDEATQRRFVCRLLEFIGCHDETVAQACRSLGLAESQPPGFGRLSA